MSKWVLIFFLPFAGGCASSPRNHAEYNLNHCQSDPHLQTVRSAELQTIVSNDQLERQKPFAQIDWKTVSAQDLKNRKRVAEIFAEGCISKAEDFAAAALVFQHGTVTDHYYQAYLWAKTAVQLGRLDQKPLMTNAIDRYLLSLGYRQLFAGQWMVSSEKQCACLRETESTFPDTRRVSEAGWSLNSQLERVRNLNQERPECKNIKFCDEKLKAPPKGLFPGIW